MFWVIRLLFGKLEYVWFPVRIIKETDKAILVKHPQVIISNSLQNRILQLIFCKLFNLWYILMAFLILNIIRMKGKYVSSQ